MPRSHQRVPVPVWERIQSELAELETEAQLVGMYHRGWRFWPPYACHSCGLPVTAAQFRLTKSCGPCGTGRPPRYQLHEGFYILGKVQLEDVGDKHFMTPKFIPASIPAQPNPDRNGY